MGSPRWREFVERSPDVVFLDIQMPGMDGFEVLRALPVKDLPAVIFLTAYEQHVLRAFDVACTALPVEAGGRHYASRQRLARARALLDSKQKADMAQRVMKMLDGTSDGYATRFTVTANPDPRIQIVIAEDVECGVGAAGTTTLNSTSTVVLTPVTRDHGFSRNRGLDPAKFIHVHLLPNCAVQSHTGNCDPSRTVDSP